MKSSPSPRLPKLLTAACLALALAGTAPAADVLVLKNGQRREGEIVGVSGGNVAIKIGPARSTVPLDQVASVTIAEPAAFSAAQKAMSDGNAARALVELRSLVQTYGGLPVDWVKRAYAMLGEAQLELKQTEEATKTFDALARIYPDAGNLGSVSVATLEVAKGNFAAAGERLAPIIAEAEAVKMADPAKSATYGKAYLLMGRVRESEGRYPDALENYLRTVAVFYADAAAVSEARTRADSLVKEKNVIAP